MNVSKLTFTKETLEKMNTPINHFKKGELRWQKLHELEDTGKLSLAKNRQDITSMMGLGTGYGAPYTWVSNMISRGYLTETLTGFDKNQRPEYEYHIVGQPDYDFKSRVAKAKATKEKNNKPVVKAKTKVAEIIKNTPMPVLTTPMANDTKMVIRYKDLVIELDNIDVAIVKGIIEALANK